VSFINRLHAAQLATSLVSMQQWWCLLCSEQCSNKNTPCINSYTSL